MKKYIPVTLLLTYLLTNAYEAQGQQDTAAAKTTVVSFGSEATKTTVRGSAAKEKPVLKGIIYDEELSGYAFIHTNGWGFGVQKGRIRTYRTATFWNVEFEEITDNRQYRNPNTNFANSPNSQPHAYIYGKQNNFYALHAGLGKKKFFSEKAERNGVAVGMTYSGGVSLGLAKPYYLDLIRTDVRGNYTLSSERYTEDNARDFLNSEIIYGSSGFTYGLDRLQPIPGAFGKIALHLDWGAFDDFMRAFEAGIMVEAYYKKVPIMINQPNQAIFINLYAALQFGQRK